MTICVFKTELHNSILKKIRADCIVCLYRQGFNIDLLNHPFRGLKGQRLVATALSPLSCVTLTFMTHNCTTTHHVLTAYVCSTVYCTLWKHLYLEMRYCEISKEMSSLYFRLDGFCQFEARVTFDAFFLVNRGHCRGAGMGCVSSSETRASNRQNTARPKYSDESLW
jgi:hypothetical protein